MRTHWIHTEISQFFTQKTRLPFWGLRSSTSDIGTDGIYILPWELNTFIFRGYNPYIGGVKPSFFMVLGSPGRWWFQIFFMFTSIWGRFPFWLIFFRWVETTNQWWNLHFMTCYAYFCRVFVGEMNRSQCTKAHFWCVWGSGKSENNVMVRKTIFSLPAKQNFLGHRSIGLVSRHGELWRVFFGWYGIFTYMYHENQA